MRGHHDSPPKTPDRGSLRQGNKCKLVDSHHVQADSFGRHGIRYCVQVGVGWEFGSEDRACPTFDLLINSVSRIHIHPDYGSFTKGNDVAVMILGSPGPNDGTHRPAFVELNREDSVPTDGDQVTAIGWGTTSSGGTVSEQLMQVELPYIPTAQCMTTNWGFGSYASSVNYASMLCAGSPGKDTCQVRGPNA